MPKCRYKVPPSLLPRNRTAGKAEIQPTTRREARTERDSEPAAGLCCLLGSAMSVHEPLARRPPHAAGEPSFWFARNAQSILFLIIVTACVGAYLAFTIPISVFPTTDFPRIVIGVDNGVMPIDQMMVTITRPLEEAVNNVPGLQTVRSITSRGSAEIDLFFEWNVDMFQTLQFVNAALSRVQSELPSSVKFESHRLTFASFPFIC